MARLDGYFIEYTDRLAYIELREDSSNQDLKDISLPIYMDDMKDGIKTGNFASEISLEVILEAMLINIAIDPDFIYREEYEKILNKYIKNIGDFTASKSVSYEEDKKDKSILIARAGYLVDPKNKYNSYLYARILWPMAYEDESEYQDDFVRESLRILQEILNIDDKFTLSYYELGNIYANLGEYIKARSYFNRALSLSEDEVTKNEVRNKLISIDDNAEIEQALYYIGKSQYNQAIKTLSKLLSKTKRADAYYYLGVAYQNLGKYENSIMAFRNSLDLNADFRELYNDYAISLYLNKEEIKALTIIEEGLRKYPQDPRMTYNKIQINLVIGNIEKAKKDIAELLTYDDLTEEIKENLEIIKNHYKL
ncbi:tetratricopeptide repeat protein [uncultured Anaerococcus sp.]|uniref:tetratricopeptide repeat protein n=1 Tax=uncultured Anaerococcus sp. TaxID=293428 RepID=UPI0025DCFDCB|nr:tetratricopeptide repeat protein [uncultured Anaerococcus sp.]